MSFSVEVNSTCKIESAPLGIGAPVIILTAWPIPTVMLSSCPAAWIVPIISTGDELKQPGEELERGQIYESNSFGLCGLVNWLGHEATRLHCVGDTIEDLRETLNQASSEHDLILTSGGVSMGDWDLVRKIMEEEGDLHFWSCLLYTSPSPRDLSTSRMPSSA